MTRQASETARQYLASEVGAVRRDWGGQLPIALVYPNSYGVGMSSLAMHTLYRYWNAQPGVVCERAFAWLGRAAGEAGPPLLLESQRPLGEAAVVAISVSFEMDYFHIVDLLRRAGIPAAGRPSAATAIPWCSWAGRRCRPTRSRWPRWPMPFSSARPSRCSARMTATLVEVAPDGRAALLTALAPLPGLYLPQQRHGEAVQRLCLDDLDAWPTSSAIVAPQAEFGDMHLIEIARGCVRGCRFCLAGYLYRPMRERSVESVLQQARDGRRPAPQGGAGGRRGVRLQRHRRARDPPARRGFRHLDLVAARAAAVAAAGAGATGQWRAIHHAGPRGWLGADASRHLQGGHPGRRAARRIDWWRAAFSSLKLYYMVGPARRDRRRRRRDRHACRRRRKRPLAARWW